MLMKVAVNVWVLAKKNMCVKIRLHTNIAARKAARVRYYFSRRNNSQLHGSGPLSLILSVAHQFLTK